MKNVPYILSESSVTIIYDGKPFTASSSNANFNEIRKKIANSDFDNIHLLFDTSHAVGVYTHGKMTVEDNRVLYNGQEVHGYVIDKILSFMRNGLPYRPLVNFVERLLQNPSNRSVQELYKFLEHQQFPITPEGNVLGYKSIRSDWTDHHTGKIKNIVGSIHEMPRNQVCDNASVACHTGYHIGTYNFAKNFSTSNSILVLVEFNPADAVSVPLDSNCEKLRVCKYKVVDVIEQPLDTPLVTQYSPEPEVDFDAEYDEGYDTGYIDGENDSPNPYIQNGDGYSEPFLEGYSDGFHAAQEANPVVAVCKTKSCKCKSKTLTTSEKLRNHANKQKRDSSGRFC